MIFNIDCKIMALKPPHPIQIPVYDSFTIDLDKYPRIGSVKENTDKVMIQFLMNQEILEKVAKSYGNAVTFYNECKEYFYVFQSYDKKMFKKFSAQEIIQLVNSTNTFMNQHRNPLRQMEYLRKMNSMDMYYYMIIRNRDFYMELFLNIQDAKHAYFQRREVNYKFNPPFDFYGDIGIVGQVYHAQELLEINAYVQFLLKNKIYKELPEPICVKRQIVKPKVEEIQEEEKDIKIIHLE
jgi:hypothetical protein